MVFAANSHSAKAVDPAFCAPARRMVGKVVFVFGRAVGVLFIVVFFLVGLFSSMVADVPALRTVIRCEYLMLASIANAMNAESATRSSE